MERHRVSFSGLKAGQRPAVAFAAVPPAPWTTVLGVLLCECSAAAVKRRRRRSRSVWGAAAESHRGLCGPTRRVAAMRCAQPLVLWEKSEEFDEGCGVRVTSRALISAASSLRTAQGLQNALRVAVAQEQAHMIIRAVDGDRRDGKQASQWRLQSQSSSWPPQHELPHCDALQCGIQLAAARGCVFEKQARHKRKRGGGHDVRQRITVGHKRGVSQQVTALRSYAIAA